jgi:hypothetical protein
VAGSVAIAAASVMDVVSPPLRGIGARAPAVVRYAYGRGAARATCMVRAISRARARVVGRRN